MHLGLQTVGRFRSSSLTGPGRPMSWSHLKTWDRKSAALFGLVPIHLLLAPSEKTSSSPHQRLAHSRISRRSFLESPKIPFNLDRNTLRTLCPHHQARDYSSFPPFGCQSSLVPSMCPCRFLVRKISRLLMERRRISK